MDLSKTGKFIQERRKVKKFTQTQLAQKIYVSEKTISKWECGKGFPDTSLILPLCQALDITANELLAGQLLSNDKDYKQQAEANLLNLKLSQEKNAKFLLTLEWILGIFSVSLLMTFVFIASFIKMPNFLRIVLCFVGFAFAIIGIHFCLIIEKDAGYYECSCCHHKYIPTFKQIFFSMHMGRTRYMKCPMCQKKSWSKKTINKS